MCSAQPLHMPGYCVGPTAYIPPPISVSIHVRRTFRAIACVIAPRPTNPSRVKCLSPPPYSSNAEAFATLECNSRHDSAICVMQEISLPPLMQEKRQMRMKERQEKAIEASTGEVIEGEASMGKRGASLARAGN